MRLKLYRAPTVAAAMALVRAEFGSDALILSTRRAGGGVEVTAALEPLAWRAAGSCGATLSWLA
jgi:flagellar biosynthesis GTPase FlhF